MNGAGSERPVACSFVGLQLSGADEALRHHGQDVARWEEDDAIDLTTQFDFHSIQQEFRRLGAAQIPLQVTELIINHCFFQRFIVNYI